MIPYQYELRRRMLVCSDTITIVMSGAMSGSRYVTVNGITYTSPTTININEGAAITISTSRTAMFYFAIFNGETFNASKCSFTAHSDVTIDISGSALQAYMRINCDNYSNRVFSD